MALGSIGKVLEFLPVLALVQRISNSTTADARAKAVVELMRFLAAKTDTPMDDEFLDKLEPALRTQEGMALLLWIAGKVAAVVEGERVVRESGVRVF